MKSVAQYSSPRRPTRLLRRGLVAAAILPLERGAEWNHPYHRQRRRCRPPTASPTTRGRTIRLPTTPPSYLYPCVRVGMPGYYDAYGNWVFGYYRYQC